MTQRLTTNDPTVAAAIRGLEIVEAAPSAVVSLLLDDIVEVLLQHVEPMEIVDALAEGTCPDQWGQVMGALEDIEPKRSANCLHWD